jgi:hypothetical protein
VVKPPCVYNYEEGSEVAETHSEPDSVLAVPNASDINRYLHIAKTMAFCKRGASGLHSMREMHG